MMKSPVVSNASPLIALHQIGQLALLPQLFETVFVPTAVIAEITLDNLRAYNFRIADSLYDLVLKDAGESL